MEGSRETFWNSVIGDEIQVASKHYSRSVETPAALAGVQNDLLRV